MYSSYRYQALLGLTNLLLAGEREVNLCSSLLSSAIYFANLLSFFLSVRPPLNIDSIAPISAASPSLKATAGLQTAVLIISSELLPNRNSNSAKFSYTGSSGERSNSKVSKKDSQLSTQSSKSMLWLERACKALTVTGQTSLNLVMRRVSVPPISQQLELFRGIPLMSNLSSKAIPKKRLLLLKESALWARQIQSMTALRCSRTFTSGPTAGDLLEQWLLEILLLNVANFISEPFRLRMLMFSIVQIIDYFSKYRKLIPYRKTGQRFEKLWDKLFLIKCFAEIKRKVKFDASLPQSSNIIRSDILENSSALPIFSKLC